MIETLPVDRIDEARALRIELHRHHSAIEVPPGFVPRDEDAAYAGWRARAEPLLRDGVAELFVHRGADGWDGLALVTMLDREGLLRPVLEPVGEHAELLTLVVAGGARGTGLGARLYAAAVGWARDRGAATMHIDTRTDNHDGLRFYTRQGARPAFSQLMQPL
ncbi:GNAT family N-acetyltransferase [Jatrophihabitans fulvus]